MSAEYEISTIADFLKVPEEKQAACIADFITWLGLARHNAEAIASLNAILGEGAVSFDCGRFTWVDDGTQGVSAIGFTTPDGQSLGEIRIADIVNEQPAQE